MSAHTPGPWVVDAFGDVTANGEDVARVVDHYGASINCANARLIAASPDLLDALRRMVDWHGARDGSKAGGPLMPSHRQTPEVRSAMEVIAKATGAKP